MRFAGILAAAVSTTAAVTGGAHGATAVSANLQSAGTPFNPGVRGTAIPAVNSTRPSTWVGNPMSADVSRGSSIRGVFGGLEADIRDWRTRNFDQRPTTLDYLRYSRDYNADLVITTNFRGLTRPVAGATDGSSEFYDTSVQTVTDMAAQWVRYTNHIAQVYHQGDTITDPKDKAILDSLVWSTPGVWYDQKDVLPAQGETPLPKVTYWEIGNEPRVGLSGGYKVQNSVTFLTPNHTRDSSHLYDFNTRYGSMVTAMKAEDSSIKVGPCLQSASTATEKELLNSVLNKQPSGQYLPVDFISYHPYQKMMDQTTPAGITSFLQTVYTVQKGYADNLRSMVTASGRDPKSVELIASEVNVSNWPSNETTYEAQMAHALGSVETVFSFARLGLSAAHYWVFPANQFDGTPYPVYKAYEGMRDHMGDTFLDIREDGATRLYTTRDSKTGEVAVWGLNFSNDADAAAQLALSGLNPGGYHAVLQTLRDTDGPTTLFSGNYAPGMPGYPAQEVDWVTKDLGTLDLSNYSMTLPAATISVLVLQPLTYVPEPGAITLAGAATVALASRRFRPNADGC